MQDTNEPNVDERYDTPYDKPFCCYVRRSGQLTTIATGLRSNAVPEFTDHDPYSPANHDSYGGF